MSKSDYKGKLFLISGPSGVGKGTVIRELKKKYPNFVYPISSTTREIRPGEKNGEVYNFISKNEFEQGIMKGAFLEWACVHGTNYYGTPKKPIIDALINGEIVVREVDVQGVMSIKKIIPAQNLISIFLKASSLEELLERISKRGNLPEEELNRRMESARKELMLINEFNYQVENKTDQIDSCVGEVVNIFDRELAQLDQ
jgi:guanylate kinase